MPGLGELGKPLFRVRPGGLRRCCMATLTDYLLFATVAPVQGDSITCCCLVVFNDGAWEWGGSVVIS